MLAQALQWVPMSIALPEVGLPPVIVEDGVRYLTEPVLTADAIRLRVDELGADLAERYAERGEVHAITVLNGALHFASDLRRSMQRANPRLEITSDSVTLSSYGGTQSGGVVRKQGNLPKGLEGRNVLVIDDVLDSGLTLDWFVKNLEAQNPASLEVAVALTKTNPDRKTGLLGGTALSSAFSIGSEFVVGYGLDINQHYRDLEGIHKLVPIIPSPRI